MTRSKLWQKILDKRTPIDNRRCNEIALLKEVLAGLSSQHDGYEHGMGPCICEWHVKARKIIGDGSRL